MKFSSIYTGFGCEFVSSWSVCTTIRTLRWKELVQNAMFIRCNAIKQFINHVRY